MEGEERGKPQTGVAPGMTPLDPFEMFIKGMGGQPIRESLHGKMQGLIKEEHADRAATLKSGDSNQIQAWNADHPHNRINVSQALKAKQENRPESAKTRTATGGLSCLPVRTRPPRGTTSMSTKEYQGTPLQDQAPV